MNFVTFGVGLVLTGALSSNFVISDIPDFYRTHEFFPEGDQVCNEKNVGSRANIYCQGRILEAVMAMKICDDSKTFVDKPLLYSPEEVIERFEQQFPKDEDITKDGIKRFVEQNFGKEGMELEECKLTDWSEKPEKLLEIRDPKLREFALSLNAVWLRLCRQMKMDVFENQEQHSLIYVPNKFIVPGMHKTVKDILSNFIFVVNKYGFVPNGGRIYYLKRSQPPILIMAFYEYYQATGDVKFIQESLSTLEKELQFWENRRNVSVTIDSKTYNVYQYRAESNVPRPESFREDVELTRRFSSWENKSKIWRNLASAAESGQDFSSRWFDNITELSTIDTTNIIPVDLNAFICNNLEIMGFFYSLMPDGEKKETEYRERHIQFKHDFQKVFYVDNESSWFDYNLKEGKNNIEFFSSNVVPIFTRCYDTLDELKVEKMYDRMKKFGAFDFNSGIPTSLHKNTQQQWDAPNSWPPLEHMIIDGFRRSESPEIQEKAYELAKNWIRVNYNVFNLTEVMWEKYDVNGNVGSGGEYIVQAGFGWTNGVILDLLTSYAKRLDFDAVQATNNNMPIADSAYLKRVKRFSRSVLSR